jgi:hypothetical protein
MSGVMLKKETLPAGVTEGTRDAWDRLVMLSQGTMAHIARRHPELDGCEMAIVTAIENASFRVPGRTKGREILYAANLGPAAWLAIVVAYDRRGKGRVITAYGSSKGPGAKI